MRLRNSYIVIVIFLFFCCSQALAQSDYTIIQKDTTIAAGSSVVLSVDTFKACSNFIFSAKNPSTKRHTIWAKASSAKYEPLFNDAYHRTHVELSADKKQILYLKYRTNLPNAMHLGQLDSAWVCTASVKGSGESILFSVPMFQRNAVYDLDWSADGKKVLYTLGNDAFPTQTRDGDVYEYDIVQAKHTNITNTPDYWSRYARYGGSSIYFTRHQNPWYPGSNDVLKVLKGSCIQLTQPKGYLNDYVYCTLTYADSTTILYRRGQYGSNKLYEYSSGKESVVSNMPGYGGIKLAQGLYAATDFENKIWLFSSTDTFYSFRVGAIESFSNDNTYCYPQDFNTHLNWLGTLPLRIEWSTGEKTSSIKVAPTADKVYTCKVTVGGKTIESSIQVKVNTDIPIISLQCRTLSTSIYASYQWMKDGMPIAGATHQTYEPTEWGKYKVRVKNNKGVMVTSATYDFAPAKLQTSDNINIVTDPLSQQVKIVSDRACYALLIDSDGQVLKREDNCKTIDMSNWADGAYRIAVFSYDCLIYKEQIFKKFSR